MTRARAFASPSPRIARCAMLSRTPQLRRSPPRRPRSHSRSSPSASSRSTAIRATSRSAPTSGMILKTREHPFAGAQVGIDEAAALDARAQDRLRARAHHGEIAGRGRAAVLKARDGRGIHFFLIDAPAEAYKPLAAAVKGTRCAAVQRQRARRLAAPRICARPRSCTPDAEPRAAHGRAGAISRVAQMARHAHASKAPIPPTPSRPRPSRLRRRNSAPASSRTSISSPAPIRASARRTIRRCSPPSTATTT